MAVRSIRMMQAENRLKEYAFSFFIEIGCLSAVTSKSLMQLKALGFGVTDAGLKYLFKYGFVETQDGKMYLDVNLARRKIIRIIAAMWIIVLIIDAVMYISPGSGFMFPFFSVLMVLLLIPWSIYVAKPLKKLR